MRIRIELSFSRPAYSDIVGASFAAPMKYFPCSAFALLLAVLVPIGMVAVIPAQAQLTWNKSQQNAPASVIQSVQVIPENNGVTLEISSSRPITPQISHVDGPPRLVIDLPHTIMPLHQKRFNVHSEQIKAVRIDQYNSDPPTSRAVVDLLLPVSYIWENVGDQLVIHLRSPESDKPASVPSFTQGIQAAAIPVTQLDSGAVMLAGSRIAAGSSVTAGSDTAVLRLSRGGAVRVCPGTTVSITPSQNGRDLMLAMNTGAMEAHYTLQASADSVLTPDFRMMLAGPGEFDFAISSDAHGNTCVRSLPGNTASIIVSELMGDGTYQIRPSEQVVFHTGSLAVHDTNVPASCGCPAPRPATMLASNSAPNAEITTPEGKTGTLTLAQSEIAKGPSSANSGSRAVQQETPKSGAANSGIPEETAGISPEARVSVAMPAAAMPSTKNPDTTSQSAPVTTSAGASALPPAKPNEVQVEVDAPFVFRASDLPSSSASPNQTPSTPEKTLPASSAAAQPASMALPPLQETSPKPVHHGFIGKIKGFFSAIFR